MESVNIAAWKVSHPHAFIALELVLPERTVRLTSGGTVVFGSQTYHPDDADIGVLSEVGEIEDGEAGEATAPDLSFAVYTDAGVVELSGAQGSAWTLYWGLVNPETGAVIGTPETVTRGYLNVGALGFGPGKRALSFSSYTEEQFQLIFEGVRLGDHSVIARTMPDTTRKMYWRMDQPYPAGRYGGSGGGGGGRGGVGAGGGAVNRIV